MKQETTKYGRAMSIVLTTILFVAAIVITIVGTIALVRLLL